MPLGDSRACGVSTATGARVAVGIGQIAVSREAGSVLVAYGLGSCIGITVFDPASRVAGLAHVLLPSSDGRESPGEPARYADRGIPALLSMVEAAGGSRSRLVVKIAGGASVLGAANAEKFKIGERNAEAIKDELKRHGLRLAAQDLGGTKGRTLELHVREGRATVRTIASSPTEL